MRQTLHHFLNESRSGSFLIVGVILLSLVGFTLETEFSNYHPLILLNLLVALIFGVEYAARIFVAPLKFPKSKHPYFAYIFSFYGIIDLLAFLPALLLPMANGSVILRMLRVLRLFQLMKIKAVTRGLRRVVRAMKESQIELLFSTGISLALIFISAVLMYIVEGSTSPENFGSVPRSLWWAVATLTTVGYGDVYPITAGGKVLAALIALLGIVAVAMPAGILASAFTRPDIPDADDIAEEVVDALEDKDASQT